MKDNYMLNESQRFTLEERKKTILEKVRHLDEIPDGEFRQEVEARLHHVGLTVKDLEGKRVLDLGAGSCLIERVCREIGIDSVISLDKSEVGMSKRSDLSGRIIGDSRQIPLKDNSVDLIISHSAPPIFFRKEDNILQTFKEIERILSSGGEVRIWPALLRCLADKLEPHDVSVIRGKFRAWEIKESEDRPTEAEAQILEAYNNSPERDVIYEQAMSESTRFLVEHGIKVELVSIARADNQSSRGPWDHFWILKK
jgi:ubiquinone/menaquinone biosynthesis C-methylase UbiE